MTIVRRAWAGFFAILSVFLRVIVPWLSDLTEHLGTGRAKSCAYELACASLHASAHHESVYPDVEQPERDEGGAPPPAQMPPGRGMTYTMEQPDPYWDNHAAIQSSIQQYRNAALLYPAFRGGS